MCRRRRRGSASIPRARTVTASIGLGQAEAPPVDAARGGGALTNHNLEPRHPRDRVPRAGSARAATRPRDRGHRRRADPDARARSRRGSVAEARWPAGSRHDASPPLPRRRRPARADPIPVRSARSPWRSRRRRRWRPRAEGRRRARLHGSRRRRASASSISSAAPTPRSRSSSPTPGTKGEPGRICSRTASRSRRSTSLPTSRSTSRADRRSPTSTASPTPRSGTSSPGSRSSAQPGATPRTSSTRRACTGARPSPSSSPT